MTNQSIITSRIKFFQMEYPDGVPLNILKIDLDISVEELQKSLLILEGEGILFIENDEYVKLVEGPGEDEKFKSDEPYQKVKTEYISKGPTIDPAETYDLTEREIKALDLIKDLTDEAGHIPRYLLEGTLLYGELKLSSLSVYNLIMSLEIKGIIKKIRINDSEYFKV